MLWKEAIQLTAKVHLFSFEFPVKEVCTCVQELGNWEGGEVIPASQERFINFHYARSTLKFWNMSLFWNLQELLKVSEWKEWSFFNIKGYSGTASTSLYSQRIERNYVLELNTNFSGIHVCMQFSFRVISLVAYNILSCKMLFLTKMSLLPQTQVWLQHRVKIEQGQIFVHRM